MIALSVGAQDIGHEIARQLVVVEVEGALGIALEVLVDVGIVLEETVIDTRMTVMMQGAMGRGIALTAGTANMGAVIAMSVTGTRGF